MRRRLILNIVLCLVIIKQSVGGINWSVEYGTLKLEDKQWSRISLQPQISIGKLSAAFDIYFLFDEDNRLRKEDWDGWQDYLSKILYISYGKRGEGLYARLGGLQNTTLGNGLIMNRYSNMINYPTIRRIGVDIGLDFSRAGIDLVIADVCGYERTEEKKIFFGTANIGGQVRELFYFDKKTYIDRINLYGIRSFIRPIGKLELGISYFTDKIDKDNINIYGADLKIPLIGKLFLYGDYATIDGAGSGYILPGLGYNLGLGKFKAEYRILEYDFIPSYFDRLYDIEREKKMKDLEEKKKMKDKENIKSLKSELDLLLFDFITTELSYESFIKEKYKTLYFNLEMPKVLPPISRFNVYYFTKFKDRLDLRRNAVLTTTIGYFLAANIETCVIYKISYDYQGKKIESRQITTKISF